MRAYSESVVAEPTRWLADDESKPAPGPLLRVQALVNTVELPTGPDRLADPADARPWLIDNDLMGADAGLSDTDLQLLRDVREALRALLMRNGGGPRPTETETAPLRAVAAGGAVRAEFHADGLVRLAAAGDSVAERLVDLLLVMRDAQLDGSWARLKVCANDECRWAFYDRSRNHGGTWCEMSTCGNKLKNREFRARRRKTKS
jgi:predicted RNA-binding Zn ribbon-like protein